MCSGVAAVWVTGAAQAALLDRGGGLLYDTVLDVTWLQDANYARTSGYSVDGMMTWSDAHVWAEDLVYYDSVRNVNYSNWRLAINSPVNALGWDLTSSNDGSTDWGYNITSKNSELSYMYYVNLGLHGYSTVTGSDDPRWGVFGNGTINGTDFSSLGERDVGLVRNLQVGYYWFDSFDFFGSPWNFRTIDGRQETSNPTYLQYAWAVRPGDVMSSLSVPEPASIALTAIALVSLGAVRRRQSSSVV